MSTLKNIAVTHFNDGNKLYKAQLYTEALSQYEKAIDNDPTFYDAYFCIAKCKLRQKDFTNGTAYFSKYVHLIPRDKQASYVLALSKILVEEGKPEDALTLTTSIEVVYNADQTFQYVPLLLANGRTNEAIHSIININDKTKVSSGYKALLENKSISESVINNLKDSNSIPHFFNSVNKLKNLKSAGIQHKEYASVLAELMECLKDIRANKYANYKIELEKTDTLIANAQTILATQTDTILKTNNFALAHKTITILEQTKFDSTITTRLRNSLNYNEKSKNKKTLTISAIVVATVLLLGVIGYFGYNAYEKSQARENALRNGSVSGYSSYLNRYGSDAEIDKLREDKLYDKAITSNSGKDFAELSRNYPKSDYLRTINVSFGNSDGVSRRSFGLGDVNQNTDVAGGKTLRFSVPLGAKVGYTLSANNMIPISRVLTVSDNLEINEKLEPSKILIFNEDFSSNKNGWSLFDNSKVEFGQTKNKGVKISNGELQLVNELRENKLTFSTILASQLNRNEDWEIEVSITRNNTDNGTFLLFGATTRAFNYVAISKNRLFQYGYNDWDNSNENWVELSNGWKSSNSINSGNYGTNTIKITKESNDFKFHINNNFIGSMPLKRWYGNRLGFGINNRTNVKVNSVSIYAKKNRLETKFTKGNTYFCWVDELNVRDDATTKGEILTTIKLAEPVKFLGGIGDKIANATFKGLFSPEKYYEVELLDGTTGWVHGGALTEIPSNTLINFNAYKTK